MPLIFVRPSDHAVRVPKAAGSFDFFGAGGEAVEQTPYIMRRVRDGSLIAGEAGPQPDLEAKPEPEVRSGPLRRKSAATRDLSNQGDL